MRTSSDLEQRFAVVWCLLQAGKVLINIFQVIVGFHCEDLEHLLVDLKFFFFRWF